ncbi:hypothetical protein NKG94_06585 [Micromonospora sp. M12]
MALTAAVFVRTRSGQWLDGVLLPRAERGGGYEQRTALVEPARAVLATFGSPTLIAVLLGTVLLVGVLRQRLVAGVVGVGMVLGTVLVAGAVKSALPARISRSRVRPPTTVSPAVMSRRRPPCCWRSCWSCPGGPDGGWRCPARRVSR